MKLVPGVTSLAVTALLLAGTACSGTSNSPTNKQALTSSVRTPLMADPPPLDPDAFYQPEGLLIMTSAYQGLLRYAHGSTKLGGLLATEGTVSEDGLP